MEKDQFRIAELLSLLVQGKISPSQKEELESFAKKYPTVADWTQNFEKKLEDGRQRLDYYNNLDNDMIIAGINEQLKHKKRNRQRRLFFYGAAAALIALTITTALILSKQNNQLDNRSTVEQRLTSIVPAKDKAILTLSDGQNISLDGIESRTLHNGMFQVETDGKLTVLDRVQNNSASPKINTLTVPMGGTYQITLADGTRVWLNADSKLKFPENYQANERLVEITGEAYFEVAKDATRPFRVKVGKIMVEAVGTAFNINSHLESDKIKTILTEGKVKVYNGPTEKVMHAGFEALTNENGDAIEIQKADLEEALSWREGFFYFDKKPLSEILGEISRWYNVELDVRGDILKERYDGGIRRSASIETVLETLSGLTGHHYTLTGRKITIK